MKEPMEGFNFLDFYEEFENRDIPVFYKGPFKAEVLAGIASFIEIALKDKPKEAKKIYKIFIELAQNISFYSAEISHFGDDRSGVGVIILEENTDSYTFYAGNKIKFDNVIPILRKCTIINDLSREELRQFKREMRGQDRSDKGGANIGLISAALISGSPINFDVFYINDEHCFLLLWLDVKKLLDGATEE